VYVYVYVNVGRGARSEALIDVNSRLAWQWQSDKPRQFRRLHLDVLIFGLVRRKFGLGMEIARLVVG
jgi:hypothetical protein